MQASLPINVLGSLAGFSLAFWSTPRKQDKASSPPAHQTAPGVTEARLYTVTAHTTDTNYN